MSKRKKNDPTPEEEEDDEDQPVQDKRRPEKQQQKVYDFHKKTIEVYPERLRELNRQFLASLSTQITTEPYSVLVGNCLDYVRQYFNYEEDLLKYSPWLASRLKQSRSDITKSLTETIDIYEALARNDFDCILDKTNIETSSADESVVNKTNSYTPLSTPPIQTRPSAPLPAVSAAVTTSAASSPLPLFCFTIPAATPTPTPTPIVTESTPTTGFNFKLASPSVTPDKATSTSPFSFSLPNTGFGTLTFGSTNFSATPTTEKTTTTSLASTISFVPPKSLFAPPPTASAETTGDDPEESSEPPEPEKVQHESDAKFTYRCRMGVNKSGKLVKRGPVQVTVKEIGEKRQMIIRSDDTLGRLFLNIVWSKNIEVKKNSTKDLTFVCQLNPGMTEISEGEFVMILLRFDNETERNEACENLTKERA
ncbi:unnamed protein product [Rotaria magnacalcarata]|uniref:Nuclear pore complex protein Nup50 n=1 Tax=Rotaria magnacalcarata TaxID=392030 RepID=A0A815L8B9_9BILA|nr:unnamed protein product [Rotaria magnacalcarata]CAF1406069.1 unnamed protein product [Rotaria magnacalcarata]CAF2004384.1 unnamed protein product [Rotaria magnacalcarata]CAF3983732.1 unnamed protein product [Rotaria magnacalcarata]CAF4027795.1 unnamed protein product [Rotaria magnacalcarata]